MLISDLSSLLKAHIPLITALDMLAKQYKHKDQVLLYALKKAVSEGSSLSQALAKYPNYFDMLTISLIQAGEQSASLVELCENIADYQAKIALLKMRLKKALFYPVIIIIISVLISTGLLIFIVPQFEQLFENAGAALPSITRFILYCSYFVQQHSIILIAIISLMIFSCFYFKKYLSYIILFLPLIGKLYKKTILSRFAYTLSILINANIALPDALITASKVLNQKKYEKAVMTARSLIMKGENLPSAFEKTVLFPVMFIQFLYIGAQSGKLVFFLNKIADYYDMQTDHDINMLTLLLEPIVMLILGLIIGGMVIAMYLPVFELGKTF